MVDCLDQIYTFTITIWCIWLSVLYSIIVTTWLFVKFHLMRLSIFCNYEIWASLWIIITIHQSQLLINYFQWLQSIIKTYKIVDTYQSANHF